MRYFTYYFVLCVSFLLFTHPSHVTPGEKFGNQWIESWLGPRDRLEVVART